jgi:tRNA (guanine-N7-)-methyltransferase
MLARLLPHRAFAWTAHRPEDWSRRGADWPPTRYEAKALAAGAECVYLRFVRRARSHRS